MRRAHESPATLRTGRAMGHRVHRDDAEILAEARGRLLAESLLGSCAIVPNGHGSIPRAVALFPEGTTGVIQVHVVDGVIYLQGEVENAADRRLAGQVVRRVPGCRRVVNRLSTTLAPGRI